jgi:hypothetical protein
MTWAVGPLFSFSVSRSSSSCRSRCSCCAFVADVSSRSPLRPIFSASSAAFRRCAVEDEVQPGDDGALDLGPVLLDDLCRQLGRATRPDLSRLARRATATELPFPMQATGKLGATLTFLRAVLRHAQSVPETWFCPANRCFQPSGLERVDQTGVASARQATGSSSTGSSGQIQRIEQRRAVPVVYTRCTRSTGRCSRAQRTAVRCSRPANRHLCRAWMELHDQP